MKWKPLEETRNYTLSYSYKEEKILKKRNSNSARYTPNNQQMRLYELERCCQQQAN